MTRPVASRRVPSRAVRKGSAVGPSTLGSVARSLDPDPDERAAMLALVRMGLHQDARAHELDGWSHEEWVERAMADEGAQGRYELLGVPLERVEREVEAVASLAWAGLRPRGRGSR